MVSCDPCFISLHSEAGAAAIRTYQVVRDRRGRFTSKHPKNISTTDRPIEVNEVIIIDGADETRSRPRDQGMRTPSAAPSPDQARRTQIRSISAAAPAHDAGMRIPIRRIPDAAPSQAEGMRTPMRSIPAVTPSPAGHGSGTALGLNLWPALENYAPSK